MLDIEGTTTPIAFVYDTLFPFARRELETFLAKNFAAPDIQDIIRGLKLEHDRDQQAGMSPPPWGESHVYITWLMDQDRKSTSLKTLQGRIWQEGYQTGKLRGEVFPDVPGALERWRNAGLDVRIFSSGSELAQRLLFGSTDAGDLTKLLDGYFDTTIGSKMDAGSYRLIAEAFQLPPPHILFISDITRELDAAQQSGLKTLLCIRPGNHPQPPHGHGIIASFVEIEV